MRRVKRQRSQCVEQSAGWHSFGGGGQSAILLGKYLLLSYNGGGRRVGNMKSNKMKKISDILILVLFIISVFFLIK